MKKKLLFLTPTLPYPPISGGVIKSNKLVQYLSKHYALSIACLFKNEDKKYKDDFLNTIQLDVFIYEAIDIPRNIANLLLSNLYGIPLNIYRNRSSALKEKIEAIIHDYEAVFCDHYVMFQYIPEDFKGKIILHEHNCEYLIWKRYADIEKNMFKKIALLNQAYRIKKYEQEICKKADRILAAPNDTEELIKIGAKPDKFYETYHLGDDYLLDAPELNFEKTEQSLLYIGTLSWEANIDGLLWFIENSWPLIIDQHPNIKLHIIGKNPDKRLKEIVAQNPAIQLLGFVQNLEPFFQRCFAFITPLRFGSGIKVKVVNALYRGIPCITTSIGAEGLEVIDGKHILIRNHAKDFAEAIDLLIRDQNKWEEISRNSRSLAQSKYTWDKVLENSIKAIED